MSVWNFIKSTAGKITMVATTAVAGIAANFIGASQVKGDLEVEAVKKGVDAVGGSYAGLSNDEIISEWGIIKNSVEHGTPSDQAVNLYNIVNSNLDKVPMDSHFQALPIGLTIAAVAVVGIIWFLLYRHAKKM